MSKLPLGRPAVIMVDVDSTLYPSDPIFIRAMSELYGIELSVASLDHWDWWMDHITREQFVELIRAYYHSDAEIMGAEPFPGAVDAVNAWRAAGHIIHVVSDRAPHTRGATLGWLARIGLGYDTVALRTGIDKVAYAVRHKIDLVIDDKPETLERAAAAGIAAATLDYPYNRPALEAHPEIMSAPDWPSLQTLLDRLVLGPSGAGAVMSPSARAADQAPPVS